MISFLEGNNSNALSKAFLEDLKTPEFVALGLISCLITTPLWRMIEDKAINIVDMNLKYYQLVSFLLEASQNTADFMQSYLLPFGDATKVKRDVVLGELLKPHAADDTVKILLKVTLPAIAKVCLHLITDPILYF